MNKALSALALPLLLLAAGCDRGTPAAEAPAYTPLDGARIGGPFTLTNQDGRATSWNSFDGKYRLVYFGYTFCPDVCPVDLQQIMQAYQRFADAHPERAAKLQPIFISVDPERDTPAVLKTYVGSFPGLIGLTGTPEQIAKVTKDFAVVYGREGETNSPSYLVNHSRTPYLFGPDGKPLALVPMDENKPEPILALLEHLVT